MSGRKSTHQLIFRRSDASQPLDFMRVFSWLNQWAPQSLLSMLGCKFWVLVWRVCNLEDVGLAGRNGSLEVGFWWLLVQTLILAVSCSLTVIIWTVDVHGCHAFPTRMDCASPNPWAPASISILTFCQVFNTDADNKHKIQNTDATTASAWRKVVLRTQDRT